MTDLSTPSMLSVQEAHQLLKSFDCVNPRSTDITLKTLQSALLTLTNHSDFHIFGICADTVAQGYEALTQYAEMMGDRCEIGCPEYDGPVYIKFNTKTSFFHVDGYSGSYRGVLVSCQSAYDDGVNDLYGHFPLDLFGSSSRA